MDREHAKSTLRAHESEWKAIGVLSASLFSSVARGDAGADSDVSDVDVAVRFSQDFSTGGFDYFWQLEQLRVRLCAFFERKVDLVAEASEQTMSAKRNR